MQRESVSGSARKIDHLGIAVFDLAQAERLYTEVLGLPVVHREMVEAEKVKTSFIPLGEVEIELLEPTDPESPVGRFLTTRGEGLHHVAIEVEDLPKALERARRGGFRVVDEVPRRGARGTMVAFLHPKSTNGVLIELVQRFPEEVQR
ncbi:MAG: methylmalonyl-CoA epimerase [Armatimonadota bacterium]|nr:methylmalonyl-CoA epimerase [Armatimonadota bacterium]